VPEDVLEPVQLVEDDAPEALDAPDTPEALDGETPPQLTDGDAPAADGPAADASDRDGLPF
jgi:hypothetical protein